MTQEQKAKAYDEALEKAKAHINSKGIGDTVDLCKHLFSELRESEDERIRKAIVKSIEEDSSVYEQEVSKEQMLAWLEKQKESHIPWYDYQKSKEAGYTIVPNEEYEQLIKQKERKPQVFCEAKAYDLGYKQGKEDAIKEQKPAEWSEEDENMRDNILRVLSCFVGASKCESNPSLSTSYLLYQGEIDWLKSLRSQPKQDWSNEDERIINALILELKTNPSVATTNGYKRFDYIDWLKSIRPSWKPSDQDELMKLKYAGTSTKLD